jgi:hypothetical protein
MLCERQEFDAALAQLTEIPLDSGGDLAAAIGWVKSRREEALSRRLAEAIHSAREMRDRDPRGALRLLESLPEPLRNRPQVEPEIQSSRAAITKVERAAAIADIEELFAKSKISKARTRQREAVSRFGSDAELQALLARIEEAAHPKRSSAAEVRPVNRKPVWIVASCTAAALIVLGIWSLANRSAAPKPVSETTATQTQVEPPATTNTQPPPATTASSAPKEAPGKSPVTQIPAPQTSAKESSKAAATPAPAAPSLPVRPEPKSFEPPKSLPEPARQNADKGETTVAVLPPQLPPVAPPPAINTPSPGIPSVNPPPPAVSTNSQPTVAKSQPPSEASAITQVLAEFGAAFKRKDINTVSSLWPSMPNLRDYRKSFADNNYEVRQYSLDPQGSPEVQGDRAQVGVRLTASFAYKRGGGTDKPTPSAKTVLLEKRAGKWVITAIR